MDLILVRRRMLTDAPAPFLCGCGRPTSGWNPPFDLVARCDSCERPDFQLLKSEITASGDARELVIAARGLVQTDRDAFEAQGFHTLMPSGGRFFPNAPTIIGELTNEDGSLKIEPTS